MAEEIWNLSALCRCCHKDGYFRSIQNPYACEDGGVQIYADWLQDTFGIKLYSPSLPASTMICDDCIATVKYARAFKQQVAQCELKFQQYCMNEESDVGETTVKMMMEHSDNDGAHADTDDSFTFNQDATVTPSTTQEEITPLAKETTQEDTVIPSGSGNEKKTPKTKENKVGFRKIQTRTSQRITRQSDAATCKIHENEIKADIKADTKSSATSKRHKSKVDVKKKTNKKLSMKVRKHNFNCKECEAVFRTRLELTAHRQECHGFIPPMRVKNLRKCEVCHRTFNMGEYKEHMKSEHPNEWQAKVPYKCDQCGVTRLDQIALNLHILRSHIKSYDCEYCGMSFDALYKLRKHVNYYHNALQRFICDYCQKDFKCRNALVRHILDHMGKLKTVACPVCGYMFVNKTYMETHVKQVHANIRDVECKLCQQKFKAKKALYAHMRRTHVSALLQCDKCSKAFATQRELNKHLPAHVLGVVADNTKDDTTETEQVKKDPKTRSKKPVIKNRWIKCAICSFSCRGSGPYRLHLNSAHEGQSPYSCHMCGKTFLSKYAMKRHILTHNDTSDSVCQLCCRAFKHDVFLREHIKRAHFPKRADANQKPQKVYVKCDICKLTVPDIEKHTERHFNRPHKCTACERAYAHRGALNRHIKDSHLQLYRYRCDLCSERFIKWKTVHSHKKKEHPEEYKNGYDSVTIDRETDTFHYRNYDYLSYSPQQISWTNE